MLLRLSDKAKSDLLAILEYGAARWGLTRAESYYDKLYDAFEKIVEFPESNRARNEFGINVRIHVFQSHLIIYRINDATIEVIRVVHGHFDWQNEEL